MGKVGRFIANVKKYKPDYGLSLAFKLTLDSYLKQDKAYAAKVTKYLENQYADFWNSFEQEYMSYPPEKPARKTIWVMWWDGEENLPAVVKKCRESLLQYSGNYEIVYLSKYNLSDYLDIPSYILEKVHTGKITLAALSDIVRVGLLSRYGGIWLDSTILLTDTIPDSYMDYDLFTRHIPSTKNFSVANGRWSGYFWVTNKTHSFLFELLYAFYLKYWAEHDQIITYLILDYMLDIAYRHYPRVKKSIDQIPFNNVKMKELQERFNDDYDEQIWQEICKETILHKLTYKKKIANTNSFYNKIILGKENFK